MMDDVFLVEPGRIMTSRPRNSFRWLVRGDERVLQQAFEAIEYVGGMPTSVKVEWIEVPTFLDDTAIVSFGGEVDER